MILKWAGGKRAILPELLQLFPEQWGGRRYFEPFFGGGAVFFELASRGLVNRAVIGDTLGCLVNVYEQIRLRPDSVIAALGSLALFHCPKHYQRERYMFNQGSPDRGLQAARMIYLNRTCFNGLWRTNTNGEFNVPIGSYKDPKICDASAIRKAGRLLTNARIVCADFEETTRTAGIGDVVYLDPPYVPISKTANFTSYAAGGFGMREQARLAEHFRELDRRNCWVVASNSDTTEVRRLYEGFAMYQVKAPRRLSCKADRKPVTELMITNAGVR